MIYIDGRGWTYEVWEGLGDKMKARSERPDRTRKRFVPTLPWRETWEEAEADLKLYAEKHKMGVLVPDPGQCGTCRWKISGRCRKNASPLFGQMVSDFEDCDIWEAKDEEQ